VRCRTTAARGTRPPRSDPWVLRLFFFRSWLPERSEGSSEPPHSVRESFLGLEGSGVFSRAPLEAMPPGRGVGQRHDLAPDLIDRLELGDPGSFPDSHPENRARRASLGLRMKSRYLGDRFISGTDGDRTNVRESLLARGCDEGGASAERLRSEVHADDDTSDHDRFHGCRGRARDWSLLIRRPRRRLSRPRVPRPVPRPRHRRPRRVDRLSRRRCRRRRAANRSTSIQRTSSPAYVSVSDRAA
jgi:hypothetical protein